MSLLRDTRGAQLVEYLGLVGLIALATLITVRVFGDSVYARFDAKAECVRTLDGACAGDSEGPPPPPPPPPDNISGSEGSPPDHGHDHGPVASNPGANGSSSNGSGANGSGANGSGANGSGANGSGANGSGANGSGANGASANGSSANGASTSTGTDEAASAESLALARALVSPAGSANARDAEVVAQELAKLPPDVLRFMQREGITVVAVRDSVTDYLTQLKGKRPRGWPPGATWDSVPGTVWNGKQVVIALEDGKLPEEGAGHGAHSLVFHETFHAIDYAGGRLSNERSFRRARDAAEASLPAYQRQSGNAGREETFAESAAQYYGGDPDLHPALREYWEDNHERLFPPPRR